METDFSGFGNLDELLSFHSLTGKSADLKNQRSGSTPGGSTKAEQLREILAENPNGIHVQPSVYKEIEEVLESECFDD